MENSRAHNDGSELGDFDTDMLNEKQEEQKATNNLFDKVLSMASRIGISRYNKNAKSYLELRITGSCRER